MYLIKLYPFLNKIKFRKKKSTNYDLHFFTSGLVGRPQALDPRRPLRGCPGQPADVREGLGQEAHLRHRLLQGRDPGRELAVQPRPQVDTEASKPLLRGRPGAVRAQDEHGETDRKWVQWGKEEVRAEEERDGARGYAEGAGPGGGGSCWGVWRKDVWLPRLEDIPRGDRCEFNLKPKIN